jgi:thymidylate kinase
MGLGEFNGGGFVNKFIVIEGLDATGKSTLVEKLSVHLNAAQLSCPPEINIPSIKEGSARTHFDSLNPLQRRAYYRFSNLVASEQVTNVISDRHVIMDRYWTSTAAFAAMDEGFEHDIEIGQYPDEIRRPDLLILLTVDEENRLTRLHGRGEAETKEESELAASKIKREKVLQAYKEFNPVIIDTSNKTPDEVCQEALEIIQEAFQ